MSAARRLRIAIDASAVPRQMAGAGVYTYQLIRALADVETQHTLVILSPGGLFDDLAAEPGVEVVPLEARTRIGRLAWEQAVLPRLLRQLRIDVLHSPHHHTPLAARLPSRARPKFVVTIHDLTFMLIPERYSLARRVYMQSVTRASALVADAIITPSQNVRREVIDRLGAHSERVVAIPEAASFIYHEVSPADVERVRACFGLPPGYVLSVGSLEPGKNRARLLRAIGLLRDKGINCHLAVAGQPGWKYDTDYDLVRELGLSGHVSFLGYVHDRDMPPLYCGALVFAFPSLHEGFGLPILEAMACGTPVVTSSVSATAEVAGTAALLINPLDTNGIAAAIEKVVGDNALRNDLRERGLRRSAEFSWALTAQETLVLYELTAAQ